MHLKGLRDFTRDWIVPPSLWRVGRQALDRARHLTANADEAAILARNARFHDRYRGRRCFVIGNGPSVNGQDLTVLSQEITITMNWFNRHPVLAAWKPTFHCIAEPGEAACWQDPAFLPRILAGLDAQAYFVRVDTMPHFQRAAFPDMCRVHYVKIGDSSTTVRFADLTRPVLPTPDTSHLATMVAIALGCSPIYLLGLDYDWLSHRSLHRHFYDADDPAEQREDLSQQSYLRNIVSSHAAWRGHEKLRELALRRGQRIYNATEGSFLDVYPTATLSEALGAEGAVSPG
jgi:hypothetical protein